MFEGDSADTCGKFPLISMGARAEGLACTDPGVRGRIVVREISVTLRVDEHVLF